MKITLSAAVTVLLLPFALLSNSSAMGMGNHIQRSKDAGTYHLVLVIGAAEKMSGMNGEKMMGGKMARCSMGSHMVALGSSMGSGKCNHHVELHVYGRKSHTVLTHAKVSIRLYCIKHKMSIVVPIMTMMMAKKGMRDFHYGNNVHTPNAEFNVFVSVNGTRTEFRMVHLK
ncbi:MAG TPA: hypothetical protein VG815_08170 [Chloroflexota bacterium]|jgi:hypothetical protein|nr:hypothetical protein [Chloroflexota bacterium]